ncbi:MAG: hypothetical protein HC936_04590 [Leptolyngbyaceae cyanobacterium SU_3_3]|nr:hypothetical protein [Leptolyngbyaceae cyanobacterium SU_3_3]
MLVPGLQPSSAQAAPQLIADRSTDTMVKKVQRDAEDLGDSPDHPIGQTGLKNIRNLGDNIKETVELNARQKSALYNPDVDNKRKSSQTSPRKNRKARQITLSPRFRLLAQRHLGGQVKGRSTDRHFCGLQRTQG